MGITAHLINIILQYEIMVGRKPEYLYLGQIELLVLLQEVNPLMLYSSGSGKGMTLEGVKIIQVNESSHTRCS